MTALGLHQDQDLHQDPWAYTIPFTCWSVKGFLVLICEDRSAHLIVFILMHDYHDNYYDSCLSAGFPHLHAHYRSVCDSGCSNIVLSSCPKSCMSSHIHICIFKVANKLQVTSLNREYQAQLIPDQILEVVNIQLQISEDKK